MSDLTIFLARLIGAYCLVVAVTMLVRRRETVRTINAMVADGGQIMIAGVIEKFSYGGALCVLYLQHRLHPSDLTFGVVDLLFGVLFVLAFLKTKSPA